MQLPPGSASTMSMLSDVPLTGAVHLQARGVNDHVPRSAARADAQRRHHGALPSTHSAVVRYRQIEAQQLQERRNETLCRSKAEMKHRLKNQRTLNGRVGVDLRCPSCCGAVFRQPSTASSSNQKGQPTSGDQRSIVVWPVADSVPERELIQRHSSYWHPVRSETI